MDKGGSNHINRVSCTTNQTATKIDTEKPIVKEVEKVSCIPHPGCSACDSHN